ncbi:hypothetical protein LQE92_08115 [Lacrimispora sp. NSJ-141]|uniref:Aldehyde ferredoxin oxidoreductase N-terminal domain-containing protein n=1 Tax=Lientehia hominis TaxID=2897778 RepID=A0AAP2RJ50_9FIRM|nr:aldehyde ferredoxin oxidoreductase C-terminal domain-containing protein [Lientehia hominis]MCD2492590.1 hypothetical protein [Lientehia hominis]
MMGTILRVNLSTGLITTESADLYREWIGGLGVAEKILYDEVKPWVTPYDPANRLIVCTGALSGTFCPGTGRIVTVTKSPVTMGIASGNAGGSFGANLRYAGFEYIVVEGRSAKPVYLYIKDGNAEIKSAYAITGYTVDKAVDWLEETHGTEISTMCIGTAGEQVVRFACVTVDRYRIIGKCGFGAVMGSKNLKAVVADGSEGSVSVDDVMGFKRKVDEIYGRFDGNEAYKNLMSYGTLCCVPSKYRVGGFSYRHGQNLHISEDMLDTYDPAMICGKYTLRQTSCRGCLVGCQNRHRIPDGPYAGLEMEGAPFNSILNFGTKLDIADYGFCIQATWLCNNLGMDMDVIAEILGWVMECYEKGLITSDQLDGLELHFGNQEAALKLIEKIAGRDGVGSILAEGVARASTVFSSKTSYYGIHVKGNELFELVRPLIGYGLGALTSTRGGSHVLGSPVCEAGIFSETEKEAALRKFKVHTFNDPVAYEGKPEIVMYYEDISRACGCLGLCLMVSDWQQIQMMDMEDFSDFLRLAAGVELTPEEFKVRMQAILNLEKMFNYCHAGYTRKDDRPRERLFREPVRSGPAKGLALDREKWEKMMDHYYEIHGWDKETGLPTAETLANCGLAELIPDLGRPAQAPGRAYCQEEPVPGED